MRPNKAMTVNPVYSKTWYWLKINDRKTTFPALVEDAPYEALVQGSLEQSLLETPPSSGAAGEDLVALFNDAALPQHAYALTQGTGTLHLSYALSDVPQGSRIRLETPEGTSLTVVEDLTSNDASAACLALETEVQVAEDSALTLVQIYRAKEAAHIISSITGSVQKNAHMTLVQLVVGGEENDIAARIELAGDKSQLNIHTAYLGDKDRVLDFNYYIPHQGKESLSQIQIGGSLSDTAQKAFRGVIDFLHGSSGSKGAEREEVLLLSDGIRNQTLPVILCHEDDVEGAHGASIGKIDDQTLFYLQSRGLSVPEIYQLLSGAKLKAAIHQIPDQAVRDEIEAFPEFQ